MSLRLRLLLIIGCAFSLLWVVASAWMLVNLRSEFSAALDERLAASARMVAGLLAQSAAPLLPAISPTRAVQDVGAADGVACEVRLARGAVVARTHNSPETLGLAASGYRTRTIEGTRWRSYTLEQNGVRITTADRMERREQLLHGVAATAAVPVLIAIAGSLVALWFGIRSGLAPLEKIRKALETRDPAAPTALPALPAPAELAPLVATIDALLLRIGGAMERERSFTGDAAHELRTPLTAVKTHIQVARLAGGGAGTATALAHAEQGVLRLQSTIDQLLLLARLEGPFPFDADDAAGARSVADAAVQQLAPDCQRRIAIVGDGAARALAMPSALAVTALRNLLDNALRHAPADSTIVVRIDASPGALSFSVDDEGPGMSEAERRQAPQRFWRKGRGQGSGLGLSIIDAIAQRYGGRLVLENRAQGGLTARLTLPAA